MYSKIGIFLFGCSWSMFVPSYFDPESSVAPGSSRDVILWSAAFGGYSLFWALTCFSIVFFSTNQAASVALVVQTGMCAFFAHFHATYTPIMTGEDATEIMIAWAIGIPIGALFLLLDVYLAKPTRKGRTL